jgi:UDP-2,3-diacylglucosamine hydrolase
MRENGTLLLSDAHYGAAPESHERAFLLFLDGVADRTSDLVINGDLFDFWFEYGSVLLRRHFDVLVRLRTLVDAGVRIRMVSGNHDFWGGSFLREEIGVELLEGPVRTTLGGRPSILAHGDGLGPGDLGYKVLKRVIRSPVARFGFRWLHPDLSAHLVRGVSRTESRHGGVPDEESLARAGVLRAWATGTLASHPEVELVALAHCHVPELTEVEPGRIYVNSGDWVQHCTWAEIERDRVRLLRHPPGRTDAEPELLSEIPSPAGDASGGNARRPRDQGPTGTL